MTHTLLPIYLVRGLVRAGPPPRTWDFGPIEITIRNFVKPVPLAAQLFGEKLVRAACSHRAAAADPVGFDTPEDAAQAYMQHQQREHEHAAELKEVKPLAEEEDGGRAWEGMP